MPKSSSFTHQTRPVVTLCQLDSFLNVHSEVSKRRVQHRASDKSTPRNLVAHLSKIN